VRTFVNKHLPGGYVEVMRWGMITWEVPLERYPNTYNGKPLAYISLAAHKNHYALYLMGVYENSVHEQWLRAEYDAAGKKLDMGKSCLRFRSLDDLLMDVLAFIIASTPPEVFISRYEASRQG